MLSPGCSPDHQEHEETRAQPCGRNCLPLAKNALFTSCCIRLMTFTGISSEGWMLDAGPRGKTSQDWIFRAQEQKSHLQHHKVCHAMICQMPKAIALVRTHRAIQLRPYPMLVAVVINSTDHGLGCEDHTEPVETMASSPLCRDQESTRGDDQKISSMPRQPRSFHLCWLLEGFRAQWCYLSLSFKLRRPHIGDTSILTGQETLSFCW